jgi:N-acetylmuramoyl-L-alanine amidase
MIKLCNNTEIKKLQKALFQAGFNVKIDGINGKNTTSALNAYCEQLSKSKVELLKYLNVQFDNFNINKKVVFVDAGHGGINEKGEYTTNGKFAKHTIELHTKSGYYFEGHENRIAAEKFISLLIAEGIEFVRLYDPFKDVSLRERKELLNRYLNLGFDGFLISFHSNAIEGTKQKKDSTKGLSVWTSKGQDESDKLADLHVQNLQNCCANFKMMRQNWTDNDDDYEANFSILRVPVPAILEEFGFHSSEPEVAEIIKEENRNNRAKAALLTAKQFFKNA